MADKAPDPAKPEDPALVIKAGFDLPPEDAERLIREQLAAIKRGG